MYIKCECIIYFTDINECNGLLVSCEHSCINTVGSYECDCDNGYELHSNGRSCNGLYCKLNPMSFPYFIYLFQFCILVYWYLLGVFKQCLDKMRCLANIQVARKWPKITLNKTVIALESNVTNLKIFIYFV